MTGWGYVSGLLRSYYKYFIDKPILQKWCEAETNEAFFKNIDDSIYSGLFDENTLFQYDAKFEENTLAGYAEVEAIFPEDYLTRIRRMNYDLNNMKIIYKSNLLGQDIEWEALSEEGIFAPEDIFTFIEEKLYFKFPEAISRGLYTLAEKLGSTENLQIIDFILDSAFWQNRFDLFATKKEYKPISDFYSVIVDLENIKNLFRAKRLDMDRTIYEYLLLDNGAISTDFLDELYLGDISDIADGIRKSAYGSALSNGLTSYEETRTFSVLEKNMDEHLINVMRKFSYVSSGPEVGEEYLFKKAMEIKNLKIIFIGVLNNMKPEDIKERIRYASE